MTTTQTIACPHCGVANPLGSAFCASCAKALPSAIPAGPRVLTGDALPSSAAGQALVGDELSKQTKRASYALLIVGIVQMTCGAIVVALLANAPKSARTDPQLSVPLLLIAQFVVAAIFIGLFFWARKAPLPATIVGLVIYVTLIALNVTSAIADLKRGGERRGLGGIGIGWLDIVIIAILAQGIQAALKHKRLLQQRAGT